MTEVTIFHNARCSTSRHALAVAADNGVDVQVVPYLERPPDRETLQHIVDTLEDDVADLVRKDDRFRELGLDAADYTAGGSVIDLLLAHPELLQRPLIVRDGRTYIGRPKDRIAELLRP